MRVLFVFLLLVSSCSSISTGYYIKTDNKLTANETCAAGPDDFVSCARLPFEGMSLVFWAATPAHPTMRGPCLFPLIPEDQPILDTYELHLRLRVMRSSSANSDVRLSSGSFTVLADGRAEKPTGVTEYRYEGGTDSILEYYSSDEPLPASFKIDSDRTFDVWLPGIVYSRTKSFEIEPVFLIQGESRKAPRIRFEPAFRRDYSPYYFPFMYPPVR